MKKILIPLFIILVGLLFYKPLEEENIPVVNYYDVNVRGEVLRPGSYQVPEKTTVRAVITMAGLKESSIFIDDNDIIVKNRDINVHKRVMSIDVNLASKKELMEIPTVGEKKALLIIEYRNKHRINNYNELKQVLKITNDETLLKVMAYTIIK